MPTTLFHFNFQKAFDKALHNLVIRLAVRYGVFDKALSWLASFLAICKLQVRVEDSVSQVSKITSGVIQSSFFGPDLYTVFIDKLLQLIKHPTVWFCRWFKIHRRCDWGAYSNHTIRHWCSNLMGQCSPYTPLNWKVWCTTLRYKATAHAYMIDGKLLNSFDSFADLGLIKQHVGLWQPLPECHY